MLSGILLFFGAVSEQDSVYTIYKEYIVIPAVFYVYVYTIYMNNAGNSINTYSIAVFPWKMLLRGLEFDLIIPYVTPH